MKNRGPLQRWAQKITWIFGILIIWEICSWLLLNVFQVRLAQSKLPYIHKLIETLTSYWGTLFSEGWVTFANASIGFAAGASAGILLAILMSSSRWIEQLTFPYAVASQMIPILGLAPIVYGIVRDVQLARILIAGYITFFPVAMNVLRGLRSAEPTAMELMHSYAAKPWTVYWKLKFPAALPGLFSGLKIAAPLAVTGAILVELMGASNGLGVIMLRNLYYGPSHIYMFWLTVILGALLGILSYFIITIIERLVTPWQPEFRSLGGDD
ncbi:ABC transporter permease [Evansella cellulosilytica]|uniref:Binding-protein-dependent transport systems inner membrane component n=1 Tax=Evansella cellulosilytica (strain ATCC 21833 / DSM 2522 / FERM P-1141 / JCM 9156 / N-4) TaxID=649639 RepID=E6TSR5_EVAC2|nr:ABC transporter permease [Evansella cellulosilytica]ADU29573.1 binding-protein-dependent transport systems inner membrane component [Evansella cellulosilytica DSM 2522]